MIGMPAAKPDIVELETALRAQLSKIEELRRKRAELEREEAELAASLQMIHLPSASLRAQASGTVNAQTTNEKKLFGLWTPYEPKTQKDWILHLLKVNGPLTRDEIFEKMGVTDKRPSKPDQLSAILSREKKAERLSFDSKSSKWSLASQEDIL